MLTLLPFLAVLVGLAASDLQRIDQTPGVVAVETVISGGQQISSLDDLADELGLDTNVWSLEIERSRYISDSLSRQRLRLKYNGLKVRTFVLQASVDGDGYYTGAVSGYLPSISNCDVSAGENVKQKDVEDALAKLVNDNNVRINQGDIKRNDLDGFSYERQLAVDFDTGASSVVFYAAATVNIVNYIRSPRGLFDTDLELIKGRVNVRNANQETSCPSGQGGNVDFPGYVYGPEDGQVCLRAQTSGKNCILESEFIVVKDVEGDMDRSKAKTVKFKCEDGLTDANNGAYSANADAFKFGGAFFDVISLWGKASEFGFTPVTLYTHYGEWTNAFWDGESATFGDSDENVYPYAVSEVIGHELGHAVVEDYGNLNFERESTPIDESFADICGKAVTVFLGNCDDTIDWSFAHNIIRVGNRPGLRVFDDPSQDGRTKDHVDDFDLVADDQAALGVGIFDKAFYLAVSGGIAFPDAFEAVVLANNLYWHEDTGFFDGACGVLRAANDLGQNIAIYQTAFSGVGIDLSFCSVAGTA